MKHVLQDKGSCVISKISNVAIIILKLWKHYIFQVSLGNRKKTSSVKAKANEQARFLSKTYTIKIFRDRQAKF